MSLSPRTNSQVSISIRPHLRCPGSCPSLPRLSQYRLVVDIEQDSGGRAALSQSPRRQPSRTPTLLTTHLVLPRLCRSINVSNILPYRPYLSSNIHNAGLLTLGYAFSKSSNLATILSFSSLASPPVLPTLFA